MKSITSFVVGALVLAVGGIASAQDKKAAPPPPPPVKAAPADKAPATQPATTTPPAAPAEMKPAAPAPELLEAGKGMKGVWKCKGTAMMEPGKKAEFEGTSKFSMDLDNYWIKGEFASKKSKTNPVAYKGMSYRTYDPVTKKWYQISADNMGGWATAWSAGPAADGKTTWEGEGMMMGMKLKSRDYEQPTPEKTVHIWGEGSMDGGKTWMPIYDMTCKR